MYWSPPVLSPLGHCFFVFFSLIWLYNNSLKRLFWITNLIASARYFLFTLYFRNFQLLIITALYLFVLILIRDIIMDFETTKAIGCPPHTFQIVFGHTTTKIILSVLVLITYLPVYRLINNDLGLMVYYYYWSVIFLGFVVLLLWWGSTQKTYLWLHNLLKAHILLGVMGIYFMYK